MSSTLVRSPTFPGMQADPVDMELSIQRGDLACLTEEDPALRFTKTAAQAQPPLASTKDPGFTLDQGVLYRWVEGKSQVVVPRALRHRLLSLAHDPPVAGHLGPEKTLACIVPCFYWPGIKAQVHKYCLECRKLHQDKKP